MFGGAERTTANLLNHLDRQRITRITLVAPGVLRTCLPERYDHFVDAAHHHLEGGFTTPRSLYQQARATSELLRALKPDVALGMMHYSAALLVLGARLAKARTWTVASYRGPFYEYMRYYERGFRRRLFLRAAVAGTALLADRIIVPSHGTASELRERFFTPLSRTVIIPNGIDLKTVATLSQQFAPELIDLEAEKTPVICAIARLAPEKNLGLLLEAFRRVRATQPAVLIILGDGPERNALEARIVEWGLSDAVRLLGHRENVYPYLRRADLFIHTCQFEGFGYTLLEALACNVAVVSIDCPYGPREILGDNVYGILVQPDDPAALAAAILRLLTDSNQRKALAARSLERAKQLSIEQMVKAYERVFIGLAGSG
ncbi:MAG: glycosyltransferase [Candidatus Competibacteraceae bacterium]|nr:glycosyltransferase [Candidatus Competibacteraceae bacterium]